MLENEQLVKEKEENKEIIRRYRQLLRTVKPKLKSKEEDTLRRAFDMAVDAHREMRRKSGEPYIYHPIAVAQIVAEEIGLGLIGVVSALLHDTVEDTEITIEDIEFNFGPKVANIIDGLTKIEGVFSKTTSMQAENFKKMLLTLSDDIRVILIKISDRLHNMRTLGSMSKKNQLKISSETLFLYAPLAHRFGLYTIKSELEDLSVKYTEPQIYTEISQKLQAKKSATSRYINDFIRPINDKLKAEKFKFEVKGRTKSVFSILKKMRKQGIPFEEVYDLFAVRIILDCSLENEKAFCWRVYSIVTDVYHPNPNRLRDWLSNPKSNGYESLHTTVMGPKGKWVEVQIRSQRMDEISEKGFAAHWKYKDVDESKGDAHASMDTWLNKVKEFLENRDSSASEFLDDFKLSLYQDEIFVFTPKGDLKKLPQGATALDFAFDIHSQVGNRCIGAKINNKLVPLSYELKSGDQIEIITSEKQRPKEEWLGIVVTGRAKTKIRHSLREERRRVAEDGKGILQRKFKYYKVPFNSENNLKLTNFFKVSSPMELYYAIAVERIKKSQLDIPAILDSYNKPVKKQKISLDKHATAKSKKPQGEIVIGEDSDLFYTMAKCCKPILGDEVFGYVTVSEGVKVHRTNCPNATRLMSKFGYRILKARWKDEEFNISKSYLVGIKITGIDDVGVIANITDIISKELAVNMKSITVESYDGTFEGTIKLFIHDTVHLDHIMKQIENTNEHMKVARIELT
jgi:guanosine-3',5'-bis(diphosphate) 3'-pyrophosphohydrolase